MKDLANVNPDEDDLEQSKAIRPGGRPKAPLIVKMRLDEQTSLELLTVKPNTLGMGPFCSMLVEYGLKHWAKEHKRMGSV